MVTARLPSASSGSVLYANTLYHSVAGLILYRQYTPRRKAQSRTIGGVGTIGSETRGRVVLRRVLCAGSGEQGWDTGMGATYLSRP